MRRFDFFSIDFGRPGANGITAKRVVNGDGQLFYDSWSAPNITTPAVSAGKFQVCPSLRWENFALGLQDYELLRLVAQGEVNLGTAVESHVDLQTDLNVSQLVSLVSQGWAHVQPANDQPFTVDCVMLEWVRDKLARLASVRSLAYTAGQ